MEEEKGEREKKRIKNKSIIKNKIWREGNKKERKEERRMVKKTSLTSEFAQGSFLSAFDVIPFAEHALFVEYLDARLLPAVGFTAVPIPETVKTWDTSVRTKSSRSYQQQ